jgi:hypothetical protein
VPFPAVVLGRRKVHAKPPDDAATGEELADRLAMARKFGHIGGIGREPAADVHLAAIAAEHLLVGGEHFHLTERRELDLDTGAGKAGSRDELLHDCARSQFMQVPVRQRQATVVEMIKFDDDVAVPGTAVVKLDNRTCRARPLPPDLDDGGQHLVGGADVLPPGRVRNVRLHEQPPAGAFEAKMPKV